MTNYPALRTYSFTILNGAALSGVVDLGMGWAPVGLEIPVAWTAADLCFECTNTLDPVAGTYGTFIRLQDIGGVVLRVAGIPTTTAVGIPLTGLDRIAWRYVKIRSLTVGLTTDANQGADRVVKLIAATI